jgi:hypothetical protein
VTGVILFSAPYAASAVIETAKLPLAGAASIISGWKWKAFAIVSALVLMWPTYSNITAAFRYPVDHAISAVERAELAVAKGRDNIVTLRAQRASAETALKRRIDDAAALAKESTIVVNTSGVDTDNAIKALEAQIRLLSDRVADSQQRKDQARLRQARETEDIKGWNRRNPNQPPRPPPTAKYAKEMQELDKLLAAERDSLQAATDRLSPQIEKLRNERVVQQNEVGSQQKDVEKEIKKGEASVAALDEQIATAEGKLPDLKAAELTARQDSTMHAYASMFLGDSSSDAARRVSVWFVGGTAACLTIAGSALTALGCALRFGRAAHAEPPLSVPRVAEPAALTPDPTPMLSASAPEQNPRPQQSPEVIHKVHLVMLSEKATPSEKAEAVAKAKADYLSIVKGSRLMPDEVKTSVRFVENWDFNNRAELAKAEQETTHRENYRPSPPPRAAMDWRKTLAVGGATSCVIVSLGVAGSMLLWAIKPSPFTLIATREPEPAAARSLPNVAPHSPLAAPTTMPQGASQAEPEPNSASPTDTSAAPRGPVEDSRPTLAQTPVQPASSPSPAASPATPGSISSPPRSPTPPSEQGATTFSGPVLTTSAVDPQLPAAKPSLAPVSPTPPADVLSPAGATPPPAPVSSALSAVVTDEPAPPAATRLPWAVSSAPSGVATDDPARSPATPPGAPLSSVPSAVTADAPPMNAMIPTSQPPTAPAKIVVDYTRFAAVKIGKIEVITGWRYNTSEDTKPADQYCYVNAPKGTPTSASLQIFIADTSVGVFPYNKRNMKPLTLADYDKALPHCIWSPGTVLPQPAISQPQGHKT